MIRIAAVADLHLNTSTRPGELARRLAGISDRADLLLLPGDLTDNGSIEEEQMLADELATVEIPVVAVLGNHDFAARRPGDFSSYLAARGVRVLDGDAFELNIRGETLGIAGVRGFKGGFGEYALGETSEPETEAWVSLAQTEADKLRRGLERLQTRYRVAMLHYAPVRATVEGEHPETVPFYGSSLLCDPIDELRPDMVIHGHSHKGTHRGATPGGVPVYNVSAKVIGVPYVVLELGE